MYGIPFKCLLHHPRSTLRVGNGPRSIAANCVAPISAHGRLSAAVKKAKALVAKMSLDQKVNITTGIGWQNFNPGVGRCVGMTPPVINGSDTLFPGLCLQDSPTGVRFNDLVSVFPPGINTAATFDRHLARKRGMAMGYEFKHKGANVALGPDMNIARAPTAGRNWEGFGADPYVSGEMSYETIHGMQSSGVMATAKHFINNEQEHFRTTSSSDVDDRTMHEIYLAPFARAVEANVLSVMCSYNLINGTYACENSKTMNGLLKSDLNFQGFIMSDWSATESGVASALGGLDMTMPGDIVFGDGVSYFGKNLSMAVNNGSVPLSRVEDMATRILTAWYYLEQDNDYPAISYDSFDFNSPYQQHKNVQNGHKKIIREIGAASTILLKNNNGTLPLQKPGRVLLLGSDAGPAMRGPNGCADRGCDIGTLALGWGSGSAQFPYLRSPYETIQNKVVNYDGSVNWLFDDFDTASASQYASLADVTIVFVSSDSGEQYINVDGNEGDRNNLTFWNNGDNLVQAAAANCSNVIVVAHSVGPNIVESWIEHQNITALLWAGLPGQESGNAIVDILWGKVNPSGRLPYTIAKNASDYGANVLYNSTDTEPQIPYSEGIFVDYRHFDAKNITPRYPFGHGLSYTNFQYTNLMVEKHGSEEPCATIKNSSYTYQGTDKVVYRASIEVENVGHRDGHEVPQLYLSYPAVTDSAPNNLRGFERVWIPKGDKKTISFTLTRRDLSYWNVVKQDWTIANGTHIIKAGASSRDIRLTKDFSPCA